MKRITKVCPVVCLISSFFLAPAAMAVVVKGVEPLGQFSEPVAMFMLGTSLIGMVGFWRRNISRNL
jgi:hypothetical protein